MWKKTGAVYDGDWQDNMRHGFGMYSMKQGDVFVKQYAGGWKEDMRDVSCISGYATCFTCTVCFCTLQLLRIQSILSQTMYQVNAPLPPPAKGLAVWD